MHKTVAMLLQGLMALAITLPAQALTPREAADQLHQEMSECVAFYSLIAEATARGTDEDTAIRYARISAQTEQEAQGIARHARLDLREQKQRVAMAQAGMIDTIDNSFQNMGRLLEVYSDSCKSIVSDPRARLEYWMQMQKS